MPVATGQNPASSRCLSGGAMTDTSTQYKHRAPGRRCGAEFGPERTGEGPGPNAHPGASLHRRSEPAQVADYQGVTGYPAMLLVMERFGYPDYLQATADELIEASTPTARTVAYPGRHLCALARHWRCRGPGTQDVRGVADAASNVRRRSANDPLAHRPWRQAVARKSHGAAGTCAQLRPELGDAHHPAGFA